MPLRTPKFWYQKPGVLSLMLTPLSWLYRIGAFLDKSLKNTPYISSIPVICVGNAITGGGGKTPTAIALMKLIKDQNIAKKPVFLTRGYGANNQHARLVDIKADSALHVGDEALLLAQHAKTIVSSNRKTGAKMAEDKGFDLIIMDDGMQNYQLQKNINLLVIDRQIDFGNNKILPAGPLRETLKNVLDKTDAIICIGRPFQSDLPVFESTIKPENKLKADKKYIAFAGLALPEKFKNTLLDLKIKLAGWYEFSDHYQYTNNDIKKLKTDAKDNDANLVTTEKDFVRINNNLRDGIETLPISLEISNPVNLSEFIKEQL